MGLQRVGPSRPAARTYLDAADPARIDRGTGTCRRQPSPPCPWRKSAGIARQRQKPPAGSSSGCSGANRDDGPFRLARGGNRMGRILSGGGHRTLDRGACRAISHPAFSNAGQIYGGGAKHRRREKPLDPRHGTGSTLAVHRSLGEPTPLLCRKSARSPARASSRGHVIHRRGLAKKKGGIGQHVTANTKRTFTPNLKVRRIWVTELNKFVKVKLTARALKTVDQERRVFHDFARRQESSFRFLRDARRVGREKFAGPRALPGAAPATFSLSSSDPTWVCLKDWVPAVTHVPVR